MSTVVGGMLKYMAYSLEKIQIEYDHAILNTIVGGRCKAFSSSTLFMIGYYPLFN